MIFRGKFQGQLRPGDAIRRNYLGDADRLFLWVPVLMVAGLAGYFSLYSEPGWMVLSAGAAGVAALCAFLAWRGHVVPAIAVGLVAIGFGLGKVRSDALMTPALARDSGVVSVAGWVESVEFKSEKRQRAVIRVISLEPPEAGPVASLRISFSRKDMDLLPGTAISFKARLFKPRMPVAPGAFDFARRDWFRGISGSGFAFGEVIRLSGLAGDSFENTVLQSLARLRNRIAGAVRDHLDGEVAAFAVAVLTGMRGGLSEETTETLRAAGLAHLLAISGLHMGLIAFTIFWLVRAGLALSAHAALHWPIKKWSAVVALIGGAVYLALSGGSVSTQRAYVMIAIMFLAVIVSRPAISLRNVALAALLILLLRPESVLNVSFQMSFLAVIGLIALYELRDAKRADWFAPRAADGWTWRLTKRFVLYGAGVVLSTLVAGLATAPVAAFHFNRVAVFGVVANLVAIPLMGMVIMPMALVGTLLIPLGLEEVPLTIGGWGISVVLRAAEAAAGLSGAMRHLPAMSPQALATVVLGFLWICLWRMPWRWAGLGLIACGVFAGALTPRPDLLVDHEAKNIAVRTQEGHYVAANATSARFALERWLAADGDGASRSDAAARSGLACDDEACFAVARGGVRVSFLKTPSALWDACRNADVVITAFSFRGPCGGAKLVVDRYALHKYGAHALHFENSGITVERAADGRGMRPWTGADQ